MSFLLQNADSPPGVLQHLQAGPNRTIACPLAQGATPGPCPGREGPRRAKRAREWGNYGACRGQ